MYAIILLSSDKRFGLQTHYRSSRHDDCRRNDNPHSKVMQPERNDRPQQVETDHVVSFESIVDEHSILSNAHVSL